MRLIACAATRIMLNVPKILTLIVLANEARSWGSSFPTTFSAVKIPAQFTRP
jgi:hypothetical protein